ncbi:MAG: hypothetical protein HOO67_06840 [Candidatus Peribacteraceae bacterium]|nr:hypothetical protein [Candidatus Peribacteraceae bacterium]
MVTNTHHFGRFRTWGEARLAYLYKPTEDAADQTQETVLNAEVGNIDRTGKPLAQLESHTRQIDNQIKEIPKGLIDTWAGRALTGFFSAAFTPVEYTARFLEKFPILGYGLEKFSNATKAVGDAVGVRSVTFEQKVRTIVDQEALRRLENGGYQLEKARHWVLRHRDRAENKLFLRRARVEVLKDLQFLAKLEEEEASGQAQTSREIARTLGSRNRITKSMFKDKEFFKSVLGNLLREAETKAASSGELPDQFDAAQKAQIMISADLFEAGVLPEEIESAFSGVRKDRRTLEGLIRNKISAGKQENYLYWAKRLSKLKGFEFIRGLESQREDERSPMVRTADLFANPPMMRPLLFVIGGKEFRASLMPMSRIRNQLLFKVVGKEGKGAYISVNPNGDVSLRMSGRLTTQVFSDKLRGGNTFFRNKTSLST